MSSRRAQVLVSWRQQAVIVLKVLANAPPALTVFRYRNQLSLPVGSAILRYLAPSIPLGHVADLRAAPATDDLPIPPGALMIGCRNIRFLLHGAPLSHHSHSRTLPRFSRNPTSRTQFRIPMTCPLVRCGSSNLLVVQRDRRIDVRRSSSRNIAGSGRNCRYQRD
jgi:hypothetical protein